MDILASGFGILLLSPFFLWVILRIKREDPGPIFFRGERIGKHGRIFKILKFRTMYERPESYQGPRITGSQDDRISPLGHWLRDTKLNELPQLWNVFVGDMSLVGPRPEDPQVFQSYPADYRAEVLSVRPGITSPASIAYHDEEARLGSDNLMNEYLNVILPDKMRLDRLYVQHHNFISDLDTIFWTFVIFIPRIGKQRIPEGWLFGGPLLRFVRRYISWFVIDLFVALLGIGLVGLIWRIFKPLDVGITYDLLFAVILAFMFGVSNSTLGLKTVSWHRASAFDVFKLVFSCLLVGAAFILLQSLFIDTPNLPVAFIILASLVVLFGFVVVRYRSRLVTGLATRWINLRKNSFGSGERVLIVGAGKAGEFAAWMLRRPDFHRLYQVVGYIDDDPAKQGMRYDGFNILGTSADLPQLVQQHNIGLLFFAIRDADEQDKERVLGFCKRTRLPIVHVPDMIDQVRQILIDSVELPTTQNDSDRPVSPAG